MVIFKVSIRLYFLSLIVAMCIFVRNLLLLVLNIGWLIKTYTIFYYFINTNIVYFWQQNKRL